ncbi:MAG: SGNH/GDSL hydrolase family protein, partial [Rikenellaceae bacterium]
MKKIVITLIAFVCALPLLAQQDYSSLVVNNFMSSSTKSKEIKIAYAGGKATSKSEWQAQLNDYLGSKYSSPITTVDVSDLFLGSVGFAFTLGERLYSKMVPDVLLLETAAEDITNNCSVEHQRLAIEGVIRAALKQNSNMDIIMISSPSEKMIAQYKSGVTPKTIELQKEFASYYGVHYIDVSKEVFDAIEAGDIDSSDYFAAESQLATKFHYNALKNAFEEFFSADSKLSKRLSTPKAKNKRCFENGYLAEIKSADSGPLFGYKESYTPKDEAITYEGYTGVPMLVAEKYDCSLIRRIKGNAIGIIVISGPDVGVVEYVV